MKINFASLSEQGLTVTLLDKDGCPVPGSRPTREVTSLGITIFSPEGIQPFDFKEAVAQLRSHFHLTDLEVDSLHDSVYDAVDKAVIRALITR
jgi:hypothetical protein